MNASAERFVAAFQAHVAESDRLVAAIDALCGSLRLLAVPCRALVRQRRRLLRQRRRACLRHLGYVPHKSPGWPDVPLSDDEKRAVLQRVLAAAAAERQGADA